MTIAQMTGLQYDYDVQVWYRDGRVLDCDHVGDLCPGATPCNARRYYNQKIWAVRSALRLGA